MLNFRRSPLMRTVLVPLTLLSFLSACHKWSTVKDPVSQTLDEKQPPEVRVTKTDGTQLMVHNPAVRNDTLFGYSADQLMPVRIDLDEVSEMEALEPGQATRAPRWVPVDPPFDLTEADTDLIRVTRMDGRVLEIENPTIEGPDLVGQARTAQAVAIPLSDVKKIQQQGTNAPATVALVAVGAGALLLTAVIIAMASDPYCGTFGNC